MTEKPTNYTVEFAHTFYIQLKQLGNKLLQKKLLDAAENLNIEPEKQGFLLRRNLKGLHSFHFSRYRIIYKIIRTSRVVNVLAVGIRKSGSKADAYLIKNLIKRL